MATISQELKGEKSLTSLQSVIQLCILNSADWRFKKKQWNFSLCFSDRVKVQLEYSCYGNIYVRLNGTIHTVCSDGMTNEAQKMMGKLVCQQLNCGKMVGVSPGSDVKNVLLRQVDCSGQEDSLWECLARYGPSQPCQSTATVSCAGEPCPCWDIAQISSFLS